MYIFQKEKKFILKKRGRKIKGDEKKKLGPPSYYFLKIILKFVNYYSAVNLTQSS